MSASRHVERLRTDGLIEIAAEEIVQGRLRRPHRPTESGPTTALRVEAARDADAHCGGLDAS